MLINWRDLAWKIELLYYNNESLSILALFTLTKHALCYDGEAIGRAIAGLLTVGTKGRGSG